VVGAIAALAAFGIENYYFVSPIHTFSVSRPDQVVALVGFLLFAVAASLVVSRFTRKSYEAERARAEAQVLAKVVATVGTSHQDLLPLLDSLRAVFDARSVALLARRDGAWTADVVSGEPLRDATAAARFAIDDDYELALEDVALGAEDRQLVEAFAGRIAVGLRAVSNLQDAAELRQTLEAEATRTGLLRAVAHDLERPLATIQFKVESLLDGSDSAPARVQRERLVAIEAEVHHLTRLVDNLADEGWLETGTVTPTPTSVSLNEVLNRALANCDTEGRVLDLAISDDLAPMRTDPDLLTRAITIVVDNACRFSPDDRPVRVTAGVAGETIELLVIDRGPGISRTKRETALEALQRSKGGEASANLGLSVAAQFMRLLGGELRLEDTPGGGLTVVMEFPLG